MRRLFGVSLLLILIGLIAGCGGGSGSSNQGSNNLPVETRQWVNDGAGFVQFYTNDVHMYHQFVWAESLSSITMGTVTAEVKKVSGNSIYGYGILFCIQTSPDEYIHNYYQLTIFIDGTYNLIKVVDDKATSIIPIIPVEGEYPNYVSSINLNKEYDKINTISVTRNTDETFTISFNGHTEDTFTDSSFQSGMYGFHLAVGESYEENFPNTPVDVRFRLITASTVTSQSSPLKSQNVQNGMVWGSKKLH